MGYARLPRRSPRSGSSHNALRPSLWFEAFETHATRFVGLEETRTDIGMGGLESARHALV